MNFTFGPGAQYHFDSDCRQRWSWQTVQTLKERQQPDSVEQSARDRAERTAPLPSRATAQGFVWCVKHDGLSAAPAPVHALALGEMELVPLADLSSV